MLNILEWFAEPIKGELHVTIPTYGHFDYVNKALRSLDKHNPGVGMHVAVIDDGSPDWDDFHNNLEYHGYCQTYTHFETNNGLTRSWNEGLRQARDMDYEYALLGNSDILFTRDWYPSLKAALVKYDLVGPMTNAPGHCPWQNIRRFGIENVDDSPEVLHQIVEALKEKNIPPRPVYRINGFCMMAKTETWWNNAYDSEHVFNPRYKLVGNEDELQVRWSNRDLNFAYVPTSFIFHYRSVSRPHVLGHRASRYAYRPKENKE